MPVAIPGFLPIFILSKFDAHIVYYDLSARHSALVLQRIINFIVEVQAQVVNAA